MIDIDATMERLNHRIEEHAEACIFEIKARAYHAYLKLHEHPLANYYYFAVALDRICKTDDYAR